MKQALKIQLADTPEGRLEQLKQFLRDHAKQFNMDYWFESGNRIGASPYDPFSPRDLADSGNTAEAVCKFEQCGTSCCIGGAARLLTGEGSYIGSAKAMGIPLHLDFRTSLFYTDGWPRKAMRDYREAVEKEDYVAATEVAIKMIDFFTKHPDYQYGVNMVGGDDY